MRRRWRRVAPLLVLCQEPLREGVHGCCDMALAPRYGRAGRPARAGEVCTQRALDHTRRHAAGVRQDSLSPDSFCNKTVMSRGTPRRMKMDSATLYMGRPLECA